MTKPIEVVPIEHRQECDGSQEGALPNALTVEEQLAELTKKVEALASSNHQLVAANEKLVAEREEYRKLYLNTLELCRKLEQGILGQKRERLSGDESQLSLSMLNMLLGEGTVPSSAVSKPAVEHVRAHDRVKPTGRKPLPENLPRIDVEVLPPEVQQQGLEAFERIGEEVTETVPTNAQCLVAFRTQVIRSWHHALRRRSQHDRTNWARTNRLAARWVLAARVIRPYPWDRFEAATRGKSRVR